jgi:hypothetical protein
VVPRAYGVKSRPSGSSGAATGTSPRRTVHRRPAQAPWLLNESSRCGAGGARAPGATGGDRGRRDAYSAQAARSCRCSSPSIDLGAAAYVYSPLMLARGTPVPDQELDVRALREPDKHPAIFRTYDALSVSESFVLVYNHDPKHLHEEFDNDHPAATAGNTSTRAPTHGGSGLASSPSPRSPASCATRPPLSVTTILTPRVPYGNCRCADAT